LCYIRLLNLGAVDWREDGSDPGRVVGDGENDQEGDE